MYDGQVGSSLTPDNATREWDAFVASAPHGYHEQTSMYGRIRNGYGFHCDRAIVRDSGRIVGGAQILVQQTPFGKFARVFRGPLAVGDDPDVLSLVIHSLDDLARRNSYASLRVDTLPTHATARAAMHKAGFQASNHWAPQHRSFVIPLQHSHGDLLENVRRKARYDVRLAQRSGVVVHTGAEATIDDFFALYSMSASFQGYVSFERGYFEYLWRLFGVHDKAILAVADRDGEPLAAMLSMVSGGRMYAGWIGTHRGDTERKCRAQALLHYRVMCEGRDRGCEMLDLQDCRDYKRKFTLSTIEWPPPMRKFYGRLRASRRSLLAWSSASPVLKRIVRRVANHLRLNPRMPY